MVVNACCHRAYNIKGTEIQIKMFDDRIVFESPGNLPGLVRPSNIRHTHFSRNPKIAHFLKAYDYVKEFGEGIDRIFREQAATGADGLKFLDNDFILRVTLPKLTEKVTEKVTENLTERLTERLTEKLTEKLTENRIKILRLMTENPYITKTELSKRLGISPQAVMNNIEYLRGKYLRRIGPDKGGFC